MLFWVIQTTILSIIFIFVVHYLINFFKSTLTVPKIKDLVYSPSQKYENIYNIISKNSANNNNNNNNINDFNNGTTFINDLKNDLTTVDNSLDFEIEYADKPQSNNELMKNESMKNESMKNELKSFLKKQMNPTNATNVSGLDSYSNSSNMGSYMTF